MTCPVSLLFGNTCFCSEITCFCSELTTLDFRLTCCARVYGDCTRLRLTRCARLFGDSQRSTFADSLRASFWLLAALDVRLTRCHCRRTLCIRSAFCIEGGGHSSWRRCPAPGFHSSLSAEVRATPPRADTGARPKSKRPQPPGPRAVRDERVF